MYIKTSEQEEMLLGMGDYYCNWGAHMCGFYETAFATFCPQCLKKLHDPNHFSLLTAQELYYPDGVFDPWHMDTALNNPKSLLYSPRPMAGRTCASVFSA